MILLFLFLILGTSRGSSTGTCTGLGTTVTYGISSGAISRFSIAGYSNLTYFGMTTIDWVRIPAVSAFNGTIYDSTFAPLSRFNVTAGGVCFETNQTFQPPVVGTFWIDVTCNNLAMPCNVQISYDGVQCDPQCGSRTCGPDACGLSCGFCAGACDAGVCTSVSQSPTPTDSESPTISPIPGPEESPGLDSAATAGVVVGVMGAGAAAGAGWFYRTHRLKVPKEKDNPLF